MKIMNFLSQMFERQMGRWTIVLFFVMYSNFCEVVELKTGAVNLTEDEVRERIASIIASGNLGITSAEYSDDVSCLLTHWCIRCSTVGVG